MNSDDPEARREQVHRGHNLETGLLGRVREWTDIVPWLRLGRTLRVAGSPPLVLLTAVTFAFWWLGQRLIFGEVSYITVLLPHRSWCWPANGRTCTKYRFSWRLYAGADSDLDLRCWDRLDTWVPTAGHALDVVGLDTRSDAVGSPRRFVDRRKDHGCFETWGSHMRSVERRPHGWPRSFRWRACLGSES